MSCRADLLTCRTCSRLLAVGAGRSQGRGLTGEILGRDFDVLVGGEQLRHAVHHHILAAAIFIGSQRLLEVIDVLPREHGRLRRQRRLDPQSVLAVTGVACGHSPLRYSCSAATIYEACWWRSLGTL